MRLDELYIKDKGVCHLCKLPVPREQASRDHLIPRSKLKALFSIEQREYIGKTEQNIALAHKRCNSRRGNIELEDIEIEWDDPQIHINPAWRFLRAKKNYMYCKCLCMCKFQIPKKDGVTICDECKIHYISYV